MPLDPTLRETAAVTVAVIEEAGEARRLDDGKRRGPADTPTLATSPRPAVPRPSVRDPEITDPLNAVAPGHAPDAQEGGAGARRLLEVGLRRETVSEETKGRARVVATGPVITVREAVAAVRPVATRRLAGAAP